MAKASVTQAGLRSSLSKSKGLLVQIESKNLNKALRYVKDYCLRKGFRLVEIDSIAEIAGCTSLTGEEVCYLYVTKRLSPEEVRNITRTGATVFVICREAYRTSYGKIVHQYEEFEAVDLMRRLANKDLPELPVTVSLHKLSATIAKYGQPDYEVLSRVSMLRHKTRQEYLTHALIFHLFDIYSIKRDVTMYGNSSFPHRFKTEKEKPCNLLSR